jgi:FtsZ-binding cell division protein ZapB
MKQKVIEFLQNLPKEKYDQFNEAFELYRKSEGKIFGVERAINASGFSERVLENLLYDLQKLHGITDVEKVASVVESQMSKVESEDIEGAKWHSLDPKTEELFQTFLAVPIEGLKSWAVERDFLYSDIAKFLEIAKNAGIKEVSDKLQLFIDYMTTPISTEPIDANTEAVQATTEPIVNDDAVNTLEEENKNLTAENEDLQDEKAELEEENEVLKDKIETLRSLPKIDAKSIRMEFPFLNEKDCPDEFKILIADKITAWNEYLRLQELLQKGHIGEMALTNEDLAILANDAVQAFDENQKIYDELNAYQTTGKVLGLHPIFKKLQLTREVEEMTADELHKYKGSSAKYFSVNKTALAKAVKAKDTVKQEEINSRVTEREQKLALVNKKLGIPTK